VQFVSLFIPTSHFFLLLELVKGLELQELLLVHLDLMRAFPLVTDLVLLALQPLVVPINFPLNDVFSSLLVHSEDVIVVAAFFLERQLADSFVLIPLFLFLSLPQLL